VGIDELDDQHRQIIDMINLLHEALPKRDSAAEIRQVLVRLVEYTQKHFSAEERYLQQLHYPALETQREEHRELVRDLREILLRLKRGEDISVRKLLAFLKNWWITHIEREDLKYASWVRRHRSELSPRT